MLSCVLILGGDPLKIQIRAKSKCLAVQECGIVQNRAMDSNRKAKVVCKDEGYNHRAAHWSDLHKLIHDALPSGIVRFAHEVLSFEEFRGSDGKPRVKVKVMKGGHEESVEEIEGDLMIAADGSMSQTREKFVPDEHRR